MAFAPIPPTGGIYDAQKRRARLDIAANSPDPVERWNAKQELLSDACADLGHGLVQQAINNRKAMERQERDIQRYEQAYFRSKYKEI